MSQVTHLASGALTRSGDLISIELHQPDSMPAAVRVDRTNDHHTRPRQ